MIKVSAERRNEEQTRDALIEAAGEGGACCTAKGTTETWELGDAEIAIDRGAYKRALQAAYDSKGFGDFAVSVKRGTEVTQLKGAAGALVVDAIDRHVFMQERVPGTQKKETVAA